MEIDEGHYEKIKNTIGEEYATYKHILSDEDVKITREFLRRLAEYGEYLTKPIIPDEVYKKMLFDLSMQIKTREFDSKHKEESCISRFIDEEVLSWYFWMFDCFRYLLKHSETWKEWFLKYHQNDFIISK